MCRVRAEHSGTRTVSTVLAVPIQVRVSKYGYGAYAASDIPAGALLWWVDGDSDPTVIRLSDTGAAAANDSGIPVRRWATQEPDGTWLLSVDGSQFFNHCSDDDPAANTATCQLCGCVYSTVDICTGTELRCDYRVGDVAVNEKLEPAVSAGRPTVSQVPCPLCEQR